ncbi:hypothetical protein FSP39_016215 [Pinctada imbricata]|uniref:Solute carrier family 23 member 2 n=1 Tax=Pinctada imbricata TaxID=66713 RepID=A0AA88XZN1_PINIB|nr:hypothetical protein FSP39_016215 [Pinctada imbricata]
MESDKGIGDISIIIEEKNKNNPDIKEEDVCQNQNEQHKPDSSFRQSSSSDLTENDILNSGKEKESEVTNGNGSGINNEMPPIQVDKAKAMDNTEQTVISNSLGIVEHAEGTQANQGEQHENEDPPAYDPSDYPSLEKQHIENGGVRPETDDSMLKKDLDGNKDPLPVEIENESRALLYRVSDNPPFYLVVFFALQQCLKSLPSSVKATFIVAEVMCARDEEWFKAQLLSISLLMSGVCTLLQNTIGVRLPVYQGPVSSNIIPLLNLLELPEFACPSRLYNSGNMSSVHNETTFLNQTDIQDGIPTEHYFDKVILEKFLQYSGALILAGGIHMLIGMTGMVGYLMKFVGPITVIPTMSLIALNVYHITAKFCATHWGISSLTAVMTLFLSLYLDGRMMPIPVWSKEKGFHIMRYPLHQVFSVLLAMAFGWGVAGIMTAVGALTDDRKSEEYYARTDFRLKVVSDTPWFVFPYPGMYGLPSFASGAFVAFMVGSITSIIDSIADYYACARVCRAPSPPVHAVNRGIMVEGFMTTMAGAYGASHYTTTYGGNIGIIGLTRVASRRVFQVFACVLILLAFLGKFASVFVTIPYPVLGGINIIGFGIFIGLVLSNLQYIDMKSTRNLAIIGISMLVGLIVPNWSKANLVVNTGRKETDSLIKMLMTNPNLAGGLLACILDNTVPGTLEERGMVLWQKGDFSEGEADIDILEDSTMYEIPSWTKFFSKFKISSKIPFFPTYKRDTEKKTN